VTDHLIGRRRRQTLLSALLNESTTADEAFGASLPTSTPYLKKNESKNWLHFFASVQVLK
jgi:hypothetical protein